MPEQFSTLLINRFFIALEQRTHFAVGGNRNVSEKDRQCAVSFYPLVGLILGILLYVCAIMLQWILPQVSSFFLAAIILITWLLLQGSRQIEGLLRTVEDYVDLSSEDEQTHSDPASQKVKNKATTSHILLFMVLLLKWLSIEILVSNQQLWGLMFLPVFPGVSILVMKNITHPLNASDKKYFPEQTHVNTILLLSFLTILVSLGWQMLLATVTIFFVIRYFLLRKFTGYDQNVLQAVAEGVELFVLIAWSL